MNNILDEILNINLKEKINNNYYYQAAFTHKSYSNENNLSFSYERLEFLGDALLGSKVTTYIFKKFPEKDEGQLTSLRSKAVREETLAAASNFLNLQEYLFLGHGEKATGGKQRISILSDIFESFLAAVYLDLGYEALDKILELTLYKWIEEKSLEIIVDYKTQLQEYVQNEKKDPISYRLIDQSKIDNVIHFVMGVYLDNILMGKGEGTTKKKAQQEAAKSALEKLSQKV